MNKLRAKWHMLRYNISHAILRWTVDDGGDIGIEFFRVVTFTKYKEHTIIEWFKNYPNAGKYQGYKHEVE